MAMTPAVLDVAGRTDAAMENDSHPGKAIIIIIATYNAAAVIMKVTTTTTTRYSHDVKEDTKWGRYEHGRSFDLIVFPLNPVDGHDHKDGRQGPDEQHADEGSDDLWD